MATEYPLLDLYHLLVEQVFGNFFLAIIMIGVVFAIICFLLRMSLFLTLEVISLFFIVMFVGYYGSAIGIFIFFFSGTYFMISLIRWMQGGLA